VRQDASPFTAHTLIATSRPLPLPDGLYHLQLTEELAARIEAGSADIEIHKDGAADVLADALVRQLGSVLEDLFGDDDNPAQRQLDPVNALLVHLRQKSAVQAPADPPSQ
jgi:hypothetical protein